MKGALLLLFLSCACLSYSYSIWPQPADFIRGSVKLGLLPSSFKITTQSSSAILKAAIARYQPNFFPFPTKTAPANATMLTLLTITVDSTTEVLQLGANENYTLIVTETGAQINADAVWGALRGLESFSQLIDYDLATGTYSIMDAPIFVEDYPRFPWRGLLIDASRHFLHVETIYKIIDGLAYNKMNTLHWHVTDSQAFPLILNSFPKMAKYGAYQFPQATYNHTEIQSIVQYGYERGVRVVPEFDMPGHAYAWGIAYPEYIVNCSVPYWGTGAVTFDVTNNATYDMIDKFLAEVKPLFMDNYIHFGGDEVEYQCWNMTQAVKDWMKDHHIPTFNKLEQYFEDRLYEITEKHKITNRVFWEDPYTVNGVKLDVETSVIEVWWSVANMVLPIKAGYKTILANGFYLDVSQPGPTPQYAYVDTWRDFYLNEPFSGAAENLTEAERALVLGGEACMWGEAVEDENILSEIWIRSSGAAEKLWSTMNFTTHPEWDEAQDRLVDLRCRMKRRGIPACPVRPSYCPTADDI